MQLGKLFASRVESALAALIDQTLHRFGQCRQRSLAIPSNVEIDILALEKLSSSKRTTRSFVEEYSLKDGRKINLLGEGRLINLAAAEGHPPSVMDMSFADQALSVEYMVKNSKKLDKTVYKVPDELDKRVAKLKLESMSIKIDKLTPEQEEYLAGWSEGT